MPPNPNKRRAALAKIHIGIKQLGMSDADHRAGLLHVCGAQSCSALSLPQLDAYLKHLRGLGFKDAKPATRIDRRLDTSPEMSKARAIWLMLHQLGVVRDPSESALVAYGKRQGKVDALQWQRRPDLLVEGLKAWAMRHLPAYVEQRLQALGAAEVRAMLDPTNEAALAYAVRGLRAAQSKGLMSLFDYYWPVWEELQP
jgi:phage gp16-like protein